MEGFSAVTRYQPDGDKVMRLYAQTALIENGRVYLPNDASWLDDYLRELAVFPNGRYDDQVDSTAQFLDWFKTPMPHWGVYEFYRRRAEEREHPQALLRPSKGASRYRLGADLLRPATEDRERWDCCDVRRRCQFFDPRRLG